MSPGISAGDKVLVDGHLVTVGEELAASCGDGDSIVAAGEPPTLRRVPARSSRIVNEAVGRAEAAFAALRGCTDEQVTRFFARAGELLADASVRRTLSAANERDLASAAERGRSTARLALTDAMLAGMAESLEMWRTLPVRAEEPISSLDHGSWIVEEWRSPLGIVGFVFEGRPNVLIDATGTLKSGNCAVFRIGGDALGTARAVMGEVIAPALADSGLPADCLVLIDDTEHAAGWALFGDRRLALAVARGSGEAVRDLGSIARRAGTPASLHGTGGAWMIVDTDDLGRVGAAVEHSLDRKVCNTVNVVCVTERRAEQVVPAVVAAAERAASARGVRPRFHAATELARRFGIDDEPIEVMRPGGVVLEPRCSAISVDELGREFEWEQNPELALVIVADADEAVELCNRQSPRFVVSALADEAETERIWRGVDAPFFGDGFTRWVDGQFALGRPELGLSNWQFGRLFGRGGVLSGDSAFTVRLRVRQRDPDLRR